MFISLFFFSSTFVLLLINKIIFCLLFPASSPLSNLPDSKKEVEEMISVH
jgi:hypothetical protein